MRLDEELARIERELDAPQSPVAVAVEEPPARAPEESTGGGLPAEPSSTV